MNPRIIVIYCGLLMSTGAFSIDITLPSFPAMSQDLAAPYFMVQWTLSIFVFLSGIGQLFWGSFSDRFGRRPTLAIGLSVFLLGSVLAIIAPSIGWVLLGRALQGIAAAAAQVCARSMLRDMFSGEELARNLALATAIFAFGPIVAPLVGASIAYLFGWRSIFGALAAFIGFLLLAVVVVPETIRQKAPDALRPSVFWSRVMRMFEVRQSRYFLLLSVVITSTMQLILTTTPRIYETTYGIEGIWFAILFALQGIGIIVGQMVNRRMIRTRGVVRTMLVANGVLILAAGLIFGLALAGQLQLWMFAAGLMLYSTSYLVMIANTTAMVLDPHGNIAGFAASFFGFISQIGSAALIALLIVFIGDSLAAFVTALLGIVLVCFVCLLNWHRPRVG